MNEIWRQCTSPLGGDLIRRGPLVCDRTPFLYSGTPHCQPWLAELSGWDPFASVVLWCVFCQALRLWHLFGFFKMSHQSRSSAFVCLVCAGSLHKSNLHHNFVHTFRYPGGFACISNWWLTYQGVYVSRECSGLCSIQGTDGYWLSIHFFQHFSFNNLY